MPTVLSREKLDQAIREWQVRHQQNMSYAELARRAEINLITLHRLKSGNTIRVDLDKLHRIGKVLECVPSELLETRWTNNLHTSQTGEDLNRIQEQLKYDDEYETLKEKLGAERKFETMLKNVEQYKGWIIREEHSDKPDVELLRPGANSEHPAPEDIRVLVGAYAEEWRRQNPPEVFSRR
jgi:DNA-binding Xre family transcriptional regulator